MLVINYRFTVNASKETLWDVISDLARYPEWNPFVVRCESSLVIGTPIKMRVKVIPPIAMPQTETILASQTGEYLSYGIKLPLRMLRSNREHIVSSDGFGHTVYESRFELAGWLSPLVHILLERPLTRGFFQMSLALKQQAESLEQK